VHRNEWAAGKPAKLLRVSDVSDADRYAEPKPQTLTARSFIAWPAWDDLSIDAVHYGPDIATEADLRLLGPIEGKRVLELGCGGGTMTVAMAKQGARVIAVDDSLQQVAHARRLADREEVKVELHQGDLADLAFVRADTVDVAVSIYSLGAVADLDRVFRQVHRVLRPEAPLVMSLPHPAFRAMHGTDESQVPKRSYFDRAPLPWTIGDDSGNDYPLTISDLFTSLTRANFRVDVVLEPEPTNTSRRSSYWTDAMELVPFTLIVRARKQGI
jgi:2-polyprenyl-3-methyl-5-hydroxy-6-metoxy-1,4-benzoquinol methylase